MKILIISPKNKTVFNFRGDLIRDMISMGHTILVSGPNRDYYNDIMALGISKFIEIPFIKDDTNIFGDLNFLLQLRRTIHTHKPDLVFSYTIKPVIYGSIAARMAGVKRIYAMVTGLGRIYTSGGLKEKLLQTLTKNLYRTAFRGCRKVIFQNPDDIRIMVETHCLKKDKACLVNGSGVNMIRFAKSELPANPVFLMIGRIIRAKGTMEFCEAARKVKREYPEARFILLGGFDSSLGALSKEDIASYIDDGSIEFPGEVKDPIIFYQQSSVFVLPSYYREGLPRTILEAMACGRPVITTDWPGCREPIVDGVNGFLVKPQSTSELVEKMLQFVKNRPLIEKMGEAAYQTCKEKYDVKIVNRQMREIIQY